MSNDSRPASRKCPTCSMDWAHRPPVKIDGLNQFRCVGCRAVYTGEMLTAPEMLAELEHLYQKHGHQSTADIIAKATGKTALAPHKIAPSPGSSPAGRSPEHRMGSKESGALAPHIQKDEKL